MVGSTEDEFLVRIDGVDLVVKETRDATWEYRYVESHPSHMEDTMWQSKLQGMVREWLQTAVLTPVKEATDQSSLYQQIRHLAALVPKLPMEEIWKYKGIGNIPNVDQKLVDTDSPAMSLMRIIASTDLHSILNLTLQFLGNGAPAINSRVDARPIATTHNLLDAVCHYGGFIQPSQHSTTVVIDDQRLAGLEGQEVFNATADNPGLFRVWYTTAITSSTGFPCRVCRVQEYRTGNRLVDVDYTSVTVIHRVFRRYAVIWLHLLHTQSHFANVHAIQLVQTHLDINDPLRKLISVCTSSSALLEDVIGQRLFFNPAPRAESFSPLNLLPKGVRDYISNTTADTIHSNFGDYEVMCLAVTHSSSRHRQRIPPDSLIFTFSPVMCALRKFSDIIHTTCRRLSTLSPVYTKGGNRQTLVKAYNASEIPCIRAMPVRDGFDVLENVILMVLQHHYTHSRYRHNSSHTTSLLWSVNISDDHVFGLHRFQEPAPQMKMQFGQNFPAVLAAEPVLRDAVSWMLIQLDRLEQDSRQSGLPVFNDLMSSITI
jgi:hypothetical protein